MIQEEGDRGNRQGLLWESLFQRKKRLGRKHSTETLVRSNSYFWWEEERDQNRNETEGRKAWDHKLCLESITGPAPFSQKPSS